MTRSFLAALLLGLVLANAHATFPQVPIDVSLFDPDSPGFAGRDFAFGTELSFTDFANGGTPISTGLKGFVASPEQLAATSKPGPEIEEPLGGHVLNDLFPGGAGQPDSVNSGEVSQSIIGVGNFANGFTNVQLDQRAFLETSSDSPSSSQLQAVATGYAPFEVNAPNDLEVLVRLLIQFTASVDFSEDAGASGSLVSALLDITDPSNSSAKNLVNGSFVADRFGVSPFFTGGLKGETDLSGNFDFTPGGSPKGGADLVTFTYEFEELLDSDGAYALGLFSDGSVGQFGQGGTGKFDSSNTVSFSIEVLTPGATLVLPGGAVVPEPSAGLLLVAASLAGFAARGRSRGETT